MSGSAGVAAAGEEDGFERPVQGELLVEDFPVDGVVEVQGDELPEFGPEPVHRGRLADLAGASEHERLAIRAGAPPAEVVENVPRNHSNTPVNPPYLVTDSGVFVTQPRSWVPGRPAGIPGARAAPATKKGGGARRPHRPLAPGVLARTGSGRRP